MNKISDDFVKDIKYQSNKESFYYEYIFKDNVDFLKKQKVFRFDLSIQTYF